ncbi:MAG TPA: MFS transporter [Chloroflexaceae bacterium]|nr:MFS transporter [Chloroflexaceae bacterium]
MFYAVTRGLRGLGPAVVGYLIATGLVGFAVDGGIYAVLLNLFLLRLGYGPAEIGLVNAAGTFTFALASLPAGLLGARWGSSRLMLGGLGMMLAGGVLLPLADTLAPAWRLPWLIGFIVLSYLGLAIFFVNTAPFLMAAVAPARRTHVVGLQTAMISLSAFAGSLVGGLLPPLFARLTGADLAGPAPYRYALIVAGVTVAGAMVAIARAQAHAPPRPAPVAAGSPWTGGLVGPVVGLLALIALVRMLQVAGVAAVTTYTNVYLDDALLVPTALIGAIIAAGRLVGAGAALTTAGLTRRFGNWAVVFWTSVVSALSILPIALVPHWGAAAASFTTVVALSWVRYAASLVYFLELVPERARPATAGVLEMAAGVCFTVVTFGGGLMIARLGYGSLFLAAAGLTALSAAAFWLLFRGRAALAEPQAAPTEAL